MICEMNLVGVVVGKKAPEKKGGIGQVQIFTEGSNRARSLWFFQDTPESMAMFHQFPEVGGMVQSRCLVKFDNDKQGNEKLKLTPQDVKILSGMTATGPVVNEAEVMDLSTEEIGESSETGLTRRKRRAAA